jgi:hypothetical protein
MKLKVLLGNTSLDDVASQYNAPLIGEYDVKQHLLNFLVKKQEGYKVAEEKLKQKDLNELAAWIAQGPDSFSILDFYGRAKDAYEDLTNENPLIRKYELSGIKYLDSLMRSDDINEADKKLLIEASAFGRGDVKSYNLLKGLPEDKLQKYQEDIEEKKLNMDADEYASYIAEQRRILFKDRLPETIRKEVYNDVAPTLPIRGSIYLDLETEEYVNSDTNKRSKNFKDVTHSESLSDYMLRELNMQSGVGFNPQVPEYLGKQTGYRDVPLDIDRYYDVTTKSGENEGFKESTRTVDRLDNYRDMEGLAGYLSGPEGRFYNQQTQQFVTREPTYGPTPELQGYQYDPRLKGILSEVYGPEYAKGFNKGGQMNLQQQANNVAAQGRYGDSMLMHVNPAEVRGLSQVMPLTVNPQTGQPEAFLPFLAPIIGSMLGPTLFSSLGGLTASALGSGLAQWAATGDIKKGMLAGLTGYGIGSALQGAAGAAGASAASDAATQAATQAGTLGQAGTQEAIQSAATQAGGEALTAATAATPWQNLKSVFNPSAISETTAGAAPDLLQVGMEQAAPSFGTSMGNLATGLSQPAALAGIAGGMGPTAIMESQELFEQQMAERERQEKERKRQLYLDYQEPILYSAGGGPTNLDESIMMDANLLSAGMNGGGRTGYNLGGLLKGARREIDEDVGFGGGDAQRFTPARKTYEVNPDFMAGFQPETMYFQPNTINQPASAAVVGGPPRLDDPYTGSKGGYNMTGMAIAPQQAIDPYAAYTGPAPQGLIETGYKNYPGEGPTQTPITDPVIPPILPPGFPGFPNINVPEPGGFFNTIRQRALAAQQNDYGDGPGDRMDSRLSPELGDQNRDFLETLGESDFMPAKDVGINTFVPGDILDPRPLPSDYEDGPGSRVEMPMIPTLEPMIAEPLMSAQSIDEAPALSGMTPPGPMSRDNFMSIDELDMGQIASPPPLQAPSIIEPPVITPPGPMSRDDFMSIDEERLKGLRRGKIGSGPGGLKEGGRTKFQEGGSTDIMQDPLTQEVVLFITGESSNQDSVDAFVAKYGAETFAQLRDYVLRSLTNQDVQTEGQIEGFGNSGMADDIPGMIGADEKIAVSQDEFIVPADVVSALGDGSSDAGSNRLYEMMDRVREAKTGGRTQPPAINLNKIMPA